MRSPLPEDPKLAFLIVDDHESVLEGTLQVLQQEYPQATIITARNAQAALEQVAAAQPNLVIVDLVMPEADGAVAQAHAGVQLLKVLMERYPTQNLVVQSAHIRTLVWLKPAIDNHLGGFTIVDKSLPMKELLQMVDWSLRERTYTPRELRNGLQLNAKWLELLQLAFQEGLQDTAIAKRMNISERTVQYYWSKIRDVLEVYPDSDKNLRIQTELRAREVGLID